MYISKIRVKDYKSFRDSGDIEFKPGINLIVGQNNAGKTTLLEALEMRFETIHHRSLKNPKDEVNYKNPSEINFSLELSVDDLSELSRNSLDSNYRIPFPYKIIEHINPEKKFIYNRFEEGTIQRQEREVIDDYVSKFNDALTYGLTLNINYSRKEISYNNFDFGFASEEFDKEVDSIGLRWDGTDTKFVLSNYYSSTKSQGNTKERANFGLEKVKSFTGKIYRFSVAHPNLGQSIVGFGKELKADASNLPEVLQNTKNDNPDIYKEFNKYVSEVVPSVKWISSNKIHVSGKEGNWNEARIWTVDKKTRRTDLAFPLSASGTGVGQVLAILYVAIASEEPRTIIIDEPNSFLHPGAAKKLIQILNKFPQHQYFISTHSPEILSAAKPLTITRLKYVDGETIAESINLEQTKDLRETLDEIGVRFSDVFFSENILWVEGETEEKAFPLILEKTDRIFDVAILPLVHTDDLRERKSKGRKHAKLVFEIYKRLSGANALTPPFVAVILDKESANEQEFKELEKIGGDKLKFIPRKMYENYLIDANAIANVLNNEITENENKLSVEQVKEWISEQRNAMFLSEKETGKEILEMSDWIETVHAAELLAKLFSGLSAKTVEYRKTTHSVKLTEWLLENKPEQLAELKDFLLKILSAR